MRPVTTGRLVLGTNNHSELDLPWRNRHLYRKALHPLATGGVLP